MFLRQFEVEEVKINPQIYANTYIRRGEKVRGVFRTFRWVSEGFQRFPRWGLGGEGQTSGGASG